MADDYIPDDDAEFNRWQAQFVDYVAANVARWGMRPASITPLQTLRATWGHDYAAHLQAQTAATVATTRKNTTRGQLEPAARSMVGQLQNNPLVTDDDRRAMEITIRKTTYTPVSAPTTSPQGTVEVSRLQHTIAFVDSSTPRSKAKPAGVRGCEIWWKLGNAAPSGPDEMDFLGFDTRTPYVLHFEMTEVGQTAYYLLRWQAENGETGPWSTLLSATVAG